MAARCECSPRRQADRERRAASFTSTLRFGQTATILVACCRDAARSTGGSRASLQHEPAPHPRLKSTRQPLSNLRVARRLRRDARGPGPRRMSSYGPTTPDAPRVRPICCRRPAPPTPHQPAGSSIPRTRYTACCARQLPTAGAILTLKSAQISQAPAAGLGSCRLGGVNDWLAVMLLRWKRGVPVCPHAGGVGLFEYVNHLIMVDYTRIGASRPQSKRACVDGVCRSAFPGRREPAL